MVKKTNLTKAANRDTETGGTRSPHWSKVEHDFLKINSVCAACGSSKHLNVHHKKPFHLHPELELDPNNLITLCMDNDCHLLVGHGDNFKAFNPNVVEDAAYIAARRDKLTESIDEMAKKAKENRLMG